jgi:hypothetical protein
MTEKTITIHYAPDETGPAQVLSGRVVRVVDMPLLADELFQDDVVLLDRAPASDEGIPEVKEVLYSKFPGRDEVWFDTIDDAAVLRAIFSLLDAECHVLVLPLNGKRGLLIVSHHGNIDPVALVEAIGLAQEDEGEEEVQEDEGEAPDSREAE